MRAKCSRIAQSVIDAIQVKYGIAHFWRVQWNQEGFCFIIEWYFCLRHAMYTIKCERVGVFQHEIANTPRHATHSAREGKKGSCRRGTPDRKRKCSVSLFSRIDIRLGGQRGATGCGGVPQRTRHVSFLRELRSSQRRPGDGPAVSRGGSPVAAPLD